MTGFVYAAQNEMGMVKFGWSASPRRRLSKINSDTSSPCRLIGVVPATRAQEADLHQLLTKFRAHREWYRPEPVVLAVVGMMSKAKDAQPHRRQKPGNALRDWRLANGITISDVAKTLSVSSACLSRIETGRNIPRHGLMAKIRALTGDEVLAEAFYEPNISAGSRQ